MQVDTIYNEECLEGMNRIDDHSIDMILCDLPYGTTACKWDIIIPFEPLWKQYKRVIKKNGAIVLFGSEPFSSLLRTATWVNDKGKTESALSMFKYDWIWKKEKGGNIGVLKYQPSKVHEIISVFSIDTHYYSPIMDVRKPENKRNNAPRYNKNNIQGGKLFYTEESKGSLDIKYPISIREFNSVRNGLHPTQKPVELLEYLIRTYTNENETVLDNCIGSGTTAIAAINTNRHYVGYELDAAYYQVAIERIQKHGSTRV